MVRHVHVFACDNTLPTDAIPPRYIKCRGQPLVVDCHRPDAPGHGRAAVMANYCTTVYLPVEYIAQEHRHWKCRPTLKWKSLRDYGKVTASFSSVPEALSLTSRPALPVPVPLSQRPSSYLVHGASQSHFSSPTAFTIRGSSSRRKSAHFSEIRTSISSCDFS